ncbi:imidazolonepropionase [Roseivirga pacifica]|uniref:imidazolonepropionase n=1 Tax=Roseivirga pacifica TaxID=1267423 RepID=UPI0020949237|nr:imidazolonepropionase [Roseivirga pacifica]MCO6357954.1 imidazolonepropionase [Roseivirga pacifica]MCO6366393.1 imidazolonepropionase [Roseivirga pacifica]MCO6370878.1 imidazolonepropionase [Roseivirga pacifica]MCO6373686.1 imidazolonepropionase [Roseivirga pacifica]MCO6380667.1 imidazolonepropionase [Roseivirga pacifica]
MQKSFINIGKLYQVRPEGTNLLRGAIMADVPFLENAWMTVKDGLIEDFGKMEDFAPSENKETVDVKGCIITPTFVDSHTHLVFAQDRDEEFVMKIKGMDYQSIAQAGGGILNSAKKLQETPLEVLVERASTRLNEAIKAGTGAIEIKSGYGLTTTAELKMLKVIAHLKQDFKIPIKATFLGAHAFPTEDKERYMQTIIQEMLPEIFSNQLADYIDCFCEKGYYSVDQMRTILEAGQKFDLKPKVHVNQFNAIGGIEKAIEFGALSVDHLEVLPDEEITLLKDSDTLPVALPGCSFYLNIPFAPGRKMIDNGLPLVLASDFNPGSAPSFNMSTINSLACIRMKLLPQEAFNATTFNAAFALELENEVGSITKGKRANFIIGKKDKTLNSISYNFGVNWIDKVYLNGEEF